MLALLCGTEGDGEALWDGRHALNAMAARLSSAHDHLPSLPAIRDLDVDRWIDSLLQAPGFLLPRVLEIGRAHV